MVSGEAFCFPEGMKLFGSKRLSFRWNVMKLPGGKG